MNKNFNVANYPQYSYLGLNNIKDLVILYILYTDIPLNSLTRLYVFKVKIFSFDG